MLPSLPLSGVRGEPAGPSAQGVEISIVPRSGALTRMVAISLDEVERSIVHRSANVFFLGGGADLPQRTGVKGDA